MLINVLDKDLKVVAFIDNEVPNLPNYYEDEFNEYLDLGTCSFDFTVKKLNEKGEVNDYVIYLNDKTCFSFIRNGKEYAVFPAGSSGFYENDFEIRYQCLSLDRELSLEYVGKLENTTSHNLEWYINNSAVISNSQIEIGVNEVASQTRVLNYDGEDTKLNRLLSLISNFNAEFEFVTKLSSSGAVDKIILNIVRERDEEGNFGIGLNRSDVSLTYGKDVYGIERTYDFDFFNYSVITGKDGLSWFSKSFEYYNSEGVLEFYKPANSHGAMAPLSAEKYPAHLKNNASDKYIRKDFSTEYTTVNQMWGYAVKQFKAHAYPKVSYTIKTSSKLITETFENSMPLNIGDTVTIQDDNFISEYGSYGLILSARVVQIKSSESNPEKNEIIFNNFKELRGEISDDLLQKMNDLISEITPYRLEINTTNGVQFKNGTGSTTLSAHIYKGSATTETIADSYEWSKDGTVVAPAQTITVDASGVANKAVYSFKATIAGKVVANQSVTITNVDDGKNGRSVTNVSQKWRLTTTTATPTQAWSDAGWLTTQPTTTATNKYLWSITRTTFNLAPLTQDVIEQKAVYGDKGDKGDTGNDGRAGKDGVGINSTTITYAISSSGTTAPTTGWTSQVPSLVKGQYLWTKTVWTYTDNSSETGYSVTYIAKDGNNGNDGIAGKDGTGIKTTTITYAGSTSGTTAPTSGWTSTVPTVAAGSYLWTKTVWTYTDNSSETGYSVTYIAKDGNNGNDGIAGKDGVGIKKTTITYAVGTSGTTAPASGWNSQVLNVPAGQYLWTKTVWDYTDKTSETGYSVSKFGEKGDKGDQGVQGIQGVDGRQGIPGPKGADGKTQYTHIAYANSADGVTDFSTSDSNRTYIGMYVDFNINDSITPSDYSWTLVKGADGTQGTPGKPGADGKTPYFHTAWSYSADGTDGFTTVYPNLNLLVNSSAKTKDGFFKNFDKVENDYGEVTIKGTNTWVSKNLWDGFSIQPRDYKPNDKYTMSMDVMFTSWNLPAGTTITEFWIGQRYSSGGGISSYKQICAIDLPRDPSNMLNQWIRITKTSTIPPYENPAVNTEALFMTKFTGASEGSYTVRVRYPKQEPGSIATPYMPSSSEVTTSDWPSFIGQYTDFTQADSTNPSAYTWSLIRGNDGKDGATGKDGVAGKDGVGIKTTVITYAISISGTIAPTTGWTSSVPSLVKGQYLWTKTVWTYTDNSIETGYSVTYIAKDGNNGNDGIAGKDGVGIKTTTITYAGSTSGTTAPTSAWTSTVPTVAAGSYLWTKTVWTYTDNTSETGYSVAKMGNTGATGPQGPQGNTGPQGPAGSNGEPGTSAINIDLSNKSYNFLANLEVSDSGSVMQAVTGSTTTTFTALQGTAAINITALTCTTTLPTGMTVSIGTLNALSVVVTISVDDTMIMPNGVLNFSITAGGVTTTKSFSYSLAINDLTVINLAAINSNLGNVKNIYSNYNGSDGGTYSGTIEINDENIKITATNDNDSNEVSKTQMNGENGIWHSTKLQKTNSPGVYILSNWSLTGTTLSFESQQSDLTYPNGYYYASYGIDMHARNIVGDSISQTTDVDWTSIGTYTKYKRQGNRITLSVVDAMVTTAGNITLGTLPAKDAPYNSIMLTAIAFATTNTNDKHIQINGTYGSGGGLITILGAAANQKYTFQQTFELT